ncbi:response regulator [Glycocaulis profundi]|nr:response regulator [Glycocaulis profundi]
MRILAVEDDEVLADGLQAGLRLAGHVVETAPDAAGADAAVRGGGFDAVVLDIMLPDGSGLDLLRRWRARGERVPVLLLTARDGPGDRVAGLDGGADDYLVKPFDLDELAARLRALVRRAQGRVEPSLRWRGFTLDPALAELTRDGEAVALSRRELAVFEALMERPGAVLSRARLEERLYGWGEEVESNAVEVHIHHLRAKLGRDVIRTVRGLGYRLDAPS